MVSRRTIVGRERPLAAVAGQLASTPSLTLLSGEAGIGKTRLVEEAEAQARALGWRVLHGESVESGGDGLPYAPLAAAVRELETGELVAAVRAEGAGYG